MQKEVYGELEEMILAEYTAWLQKQGKYYFQIGFSELENFWKEKLE